MSKKVAAVIVGTTGAVLAGVLGYAAYLNKRYDLDLEHLHEEDDYEDEEDDCPFGYEYEADDFDSAEPFEGADPFESGESDCLSDDAPAGFGFDPNKGSTADGLSSGMTGGFPGSTADGLSSGMTGGFSGSMADDFSAGATFESMGMPSLTVSDIPVSKESLELWRKFNQSRVKDAQNYMNTCKK